MGAYRIFFRLSFSSSSRSRLEPSTIWSTELLSMSSIGPTESDGALGVGEGIGRGVGVAPLGALRLFRK